MLHTLHCHENLLQFYSGPYVLLTQHSLSLSPSYNHTHKHTYTHTQTHRSRGGFAVTPGMLNLSQELPCSWEKRYLLTGTQTCLAGHRHTHTHTYPGHGTGGTHTHTHRERD